MKMAESSGNSDEKALLQSLVISWRHSLATSQDVTEVLNIFNAMHLLLTSSDPSSLSAEQMTLLDDKFSGRKSLDQWKVIQKEFVKSHYLKLAEHLLNQLSLDWFGKFGRDKSGEECFNRLFLQAPEEDAIILLCSEIYKSKPSFKRNKCLSLLAEFLKCHRLVGLLWRQCLVHQGTEEESTKESSKAVARANWDQLIGLLTSLPDKMANTLKVDNWDIFLPKQYFEVLAQDILKTLDRVHQRLKESKDCSLMFVSQLIGKICVSGFSGILFDTLLPHLLKLSKDDFIWSRISTRIIVKAPEKSLEVILDCLLRRVPWYGHMSKLIGDSVLNNQKVKYLLTSKFLLLRHTDNDLVLHNVIGYLADSPSRASLLPKVLYNLLDAWSDSSALKHTSHDQHLYITKAILISSAHLSEKSAKENKDVLTHKLMSGVQAHLETPVSRLRTMGMVVAESLTKKLTPEVAALTFEYQKDDTTEHLKSLSTLPQDPGLEEICHKLKEITPSTGNEEVSKQQDVPVSDPERQNEEEELDSDDDLEPYDMSGDTKVSKVTEPVYIRDCMEGLIAKDNPDLVEASLKVAEKLIRRKPDDLSEISVEFAKILLHLEDNYHTENFAEMRLSCLCALAVHCPIGVANYLTEQFYDRNYNIRQRIDMLEVLSSASQELSSPKKNTTNASSKPSTANQLIPINQMPGTENWREFVQRRIESNTRRFASATKQGPEASANKFAMVAGHFFFPLMKTYDSPLNTMNLLAGDFFLLGRLVHTLAIILHSAQNTTICRQMAKSLLEFTWTIRYHVEPYVRRAIMFAVAMVILSVPTHTITTDLQCDLIECQMWLEDIVEKDPEPECKKQAAQTILLLQDAIKKEFKLGEG